uniref:Uncharacterized protein n=1 Tax=Nicotiana tabacum TaxID=4097 RepID=A0A1S4BCF6_TOBAC|nr:PREDICTED: uncharacterized protein LOC107806784 [Nicotiana tabacum]
MPTSKKSKVKMLARKVVARREQIKKINEKLKAGREEEPQKSEESFKSATGGKKRFLLRQNRIVLVGSMAGFETTEFGKLGGEKKKRKEKEKEGAGSTVRGMGKGVVDSSPTPISLTKESSAMVIWGEEFATIEEDVRKTGGSGSGEATEGLVQLGKNVDKHVPSEHETLANLLKRVTASYNPKKKRSSGVNTPGTARENKKRKAASSIPVEIPPTRNQKKQSEAELKKALEESKRKVAAKGKKKVLIPKAKKAKTSTKKSVSKSKCIEPSTLAKRTRSVVKSRKVKITEEEEWSGEEEDDDDDDSDAEKDKTVKFGKRTILKGRLLRGLEEEGMVKLFEKLQLQG